MSLIPAQVKVIIFDLDDTLYDCSGTLVSECRKLAAEIISNAINCSEIEAVKLQLKLEERHGPQADIFREITNLYNLPDEFYEKISYAFNTIEIRNISLFPDVINSINKLKRIGYKMILVTAGNKDLQERKIKALGLEKQFEKIIIINTSSGKEESFKEILNKYNLKPEQVLCVGDKIKDEIEAGKNLGMLTALMKHGRYYNFYKSKTYDKPDIYISNISDLLKL